MAVVRVELAPDFRGEDVVLLAMDGAGMGAFLAALTQAQQQGSSRLDRGGMIHEFLVQLGAADIELHDHRAVWRLDQAKVVEIVHRLAAMGRHRSGRGHHYVDISTPTHTLVLSHNEYL